MPHWTNVPPKDPKGISLPLVRTPTYRQLSGIITSNDLVGTPTHFYGGRTVPCDVDDCEPCSKGVSWRWHGYVSAFNPETQTHFLLELTTRTARVLCDYRDANNGLRGCLITAWRPSKTPNGRVSIRCRPADLQRYAIPAEPDVVAALTQIWGLATPSADVRGLMQQLPRIVVDASGDGRLWKPTPNARPDPGAP